MLQTLIDTRTVGHDDGGGDDVCRHVVTESMDCVECGNFDMMT